MFFGFVIFRFNPACFLMKNVGNVYIDHSEYSLMLLLYSVYSRGFSNG
ncbi:hypothetical protein MmiEs2_06880 [Methanimicrococcus stummii]|uniref:Uncharacterized protein n=1 Tax=Methanimicrococcus stummii TaxID=3028294 RepID=A0AA96V8F1_9EURY|nr:hypothetical protein MmiEs2_06880 [Methanimicrococcus sp. Es2]